MKKDKDGKPVISSKKAGFKLDHYVTENNNLKSELSKIGRQFKEENEKLQDQLNLTNARYSTISSKFESEFVRKDQEINKLEKILSKIDQDNSCDFSQNKSKSSKLRYKENEAPLDKESFELCYKNKELEEKIKKYEAEKRTTLTESRNFTMNSIDNDSTNSKTLNHINNTYMKDHMKALESIKKELRHDSKSEVLRNLH